MVDWAAITTTDTKYPRRKVVPCVAIFMQGVILRLAKDLARNGSVPARQSWWFARDPSGLKSFRMTPVSWSGRYYNECHEIPLEDGCPARAPYV